MWPKIKYVHPILRPIGLIAAFWLLVAAVAVPVFKAAVARQAVRPDVDCLESDGWSFFHRHGAAATGRLGTTKTLRVEVSKLGRDHFDVGASHPLDVHFSRGDQLKLTVRGRCSVPSRIQLVLHQRPGGDGVFWIDSTPVGTGWTEIWRTVPAPPAGVDDAILTVFVGEKPGVYEFDKIQMVRASRPHKGRS